MKRTPKDSNGYSPSDPVPNGREEAAKNQARRWFAILLTVGLVLGGATSIGVVKVLNELGLTEKPDRPFLDRLRE